MVPLPLSDLDTAVWALLDGLDLQQEFRLDCPTLRFVPKAARTTVANITEDFLGAILRAERGSRAEIRS